MSLESRLVTKLTSVMLGTEDYAPRKSDLTFEKSFLMGSGTGLGLADVRFSDRRSVTAGSTDSLDLVGGGLLDALGNVFAPARLKAIKFVTDPANTVNLALTRPAANGVPWISVAGNISIPPGGEIILWAPSATGIVVTAGTGDLLDIVAAAGSGAQFYDLHLIGASA